MGSKTTSDPTDFHCMVKKKPHYISKKKKSLNQSYFMSVCPLPQETILNYCKDPTPQPNNLDHVSSLRNHAWIWIYVLVCGNTHAGLCICV